MTEEKKIMPRTKDYAVMKKTAPENNLQHQNTQS